MKKNFYRLEKDEKKVKKLQKRVSNQEVTINELITEFDFLREKNNSLGKKLKKIQNVDLDLIERRVDSIEKLLRVWISCCFIDVDNDDTLQYMAKKIKKEVKKIRRKEYIGLPGGERFDR